MNRIKFVPICDWPFLLNQAEPVIEERMSEVKCKNIFSKWIQSANDSKFLERPKIMQLFFNDDQKLEGIRLIMNNGSSEDFIEFGGNLQYIAPELYLHHEYHADSVDVWSLGITLYRLLVGRYPFNSDSMGDRALFERMLQFRYPMPNSLSPGKKLHNILYLLKLKRGGGGRVLYRSKKPYSANAFTCRIKNITQSVIKSSLVHFK